jgi:lipopolysaccharide/colanic/teichoic acid biosynthesis glycosyltransferase
MPKMWLKLFRIFVQKTKSNFFYFLIKRIFDFVTALVGFVFLLPFIIIIGIFVKLDSRGPVFYLQERVGQFEKPFKIWKFRTMVADADKNGTLITLAKDSRITKVGRVLRKYKLDELPQLINVIIGNMSLVGPRPEVKKYVNLYNAEQKKILDFKPGITDLASIKYSEENDLLANAIDIDEIYVKQIMPDKLKMNMDYFYNPSIKKDLVCILKTLVKII